MGQPPQWGHFTSRVSVSIIVAAPKSRAPMDRQRSGIADGSCSNDQIERLTQLLLLVACGPHLADAQIERLTQLLRLLLLMVCGPDPAA
jgi:hypothetical protein